MIRTEARGIVLDQLTASARQALAKAYQDLDRVVADRIESRVFDTNKAR